MKNLETAIRTQFKHNTTYSSTCSLTCLVIFIFYGFGQLSGQTAQSFGMEYGVILIPKISSSGTKDSNYSMGITSLFDLNSRWSIGTGIKYLKYGSHTYYRPVTGLRQIYGEALVEKNTYGIQNLAFAFDLIYKTKFIDVYVSAQPEKALFGKQKVTHKVLPFSDINFEHYPQNQLNEYNFSLSTGLAIKRNFGDKLGFSLKPSVQYFLRSFYQDEGFEDVRLAFNLAIGINFHLKTNHISLE